MGKNGKLTKHIVSNALRKSDNISEIAESLGVARINVYRAIKRWALDRPMRKAENVTPEIIVPDPSNSVLALAELHGQLAAGPPRYRIVNVDAFSGPCLGDVGRKRH